MRARTSLAVVVGLLVGVSVLAGTSGAVGVGTASSAASGDAVFQEAGNNSTVENSEYYNGTVSVDDESWFEGIDEASLDSMGKMVTRFGSYFIGTGESSGAGVQGVLLTGVVMSVALIGAVGAVGVGTVGGSVFAVVIGFGMTELGLAPGWFRAILLFGIGIIAFVSFTNILEAR